MKTLPDMVPEPGSYRGIHRFKNAKSTTDFSKSSVWDVPGLEAYHDRDLFLTEALTIEASRSMEAAVASGEPFFLRLCALRRPHPNHGEPTLD